MKDEEYFRAGIFTCEGKDYTFALKDFRFLIMNPSKDSIHALPHNGSERLHSDANGIICGTTYDNHAIAIYAPDYSCDIDGYNILRTDSYLVRNANICPSPQEVSLSFNTIKFYGGILSKVF